MLKEILIQAIGALGFIFLGLSYHKKDKTHILIMQIFSYIFFTIHFYLLDGITGAICNLIGFVSLITIFIFEKNKWKYKNYICVLFVAIIIGISIVTFQNIYSVFPMIASSSVIISFLIDNENVIRGIGLLSAICWLVYAIVYKSYISIAYEIYTIVNICVALLKNNNLKKVK